MQHEFHFISGLPRSGSTLLAAILGQNPRFHTGVTTPVASIVNAVLAQCSAGNEWAAMVSQEQRRAMVRALFDSYYSGSEKPVVFDTNRSWTAHIPLLLDLFPGAKMLACVRNMGWVMDSLERLYRANPYEQTRLFANEAERATVLSRVDALGQRTRLVGAAWAGLMEAFYGDQGQAILVIDYDILAQRPAQVIELVYRFLGEQRYPHDYDNIAFDAADYDDGLGLANLHTLRSTVSLQRRTTVLPPDLFDKCAKLSFWQTDTTASRCSVLRIRDGVNIANQRVTDSEASPS
jgi:sulfotransferase